MALGSDLGIRYYVSREAVDTNGYTELRLVIGANEYDSFSIETVGGKQYYVFTYTGILPQNVGQDVSATLKATNGGGEIESPAFVYSVKTYCYNKLESSTNSGFKGMLVDLLNYCAAAQTYFGEIDANLVNRDLTVEQKALGTASYEATGVADTSDKGSIDSVAVLLGNSIQLKVFFTAADPTGYCLEVMCNSTTKTYTECQPAGEAGKYYFIVDGLKTADIGNDMIIELKNASNVSEGIISYNLDAYYNEIMADAGATELTKKLVAATVAFIGAAEAYFAS